MTPTTTASPLSPPLSQPESATLLEESPADYFGFGDKVPAFDHQPPPRAPTSEAPATPACAGAVEPSPSAAPPAAFGASRGLGNLAESLAAFDDPSNHAKIDEALNKLVMAAKERDEEEQDSAETPEEKEMKHSMDSGAGLRTKLGIRFSRDPSGALHPQYNGNREEKLRFRQEWAQAKLQEIVQVREKRTAYKSIDKKKGVYRPFSMIWKHQGGKDDLGALEAAKNICERCVAMGGNWVRFNPLSRRAEFLDLEVSWQEEFERSWSLYERRSQASEVGEERSEGDATKDSEQRPRRKNAKTPDPQHDKGEQKDKKEPAQRTRSDLDKAWVEATAIKKQYATTMLAASSLQRRMQSESGWEWAMSERTKLDTLIRDLEANLQEISNTFLTDEGKALRRLYKDRPHLLQTELENLRILSDPLKRVSVQSRMILVMQSARQSVPE